LSIDGVVAAWQYGRRSSSRQVRVNGGISSSTAIKHAIKLTIKLKIIAAAIKLKTSPARLAQLLQPSLAFCCKLQLAANAATYYTKKLCYRKDDRAMRPIHGCPENFRDSLTRPTATISQHFSWAFVRIDPMNVPTKFEVRRTSYEFLR